MNRRYPFLFLFVAILAYVAGCAPWVDQLRLDEEENKEFFKYYTTYGKDFKNVNEFKSFIDGRYNEARAEFPRLKEPVRWAEGPQVLGATAKREMSFIHLSDVQIRDERVKLFGKEASRTLDKIIPSFEHGTPPARDMEHYDYAAYLALIRTINALMEDTGTDTIPRPKFMIHTGDAVDASVVEELYEFIYISNKLKMPWFNVLGNHDITVFGNFDNKKVYVNDPDLTFQTLHNKFNFINMHGGGHLIDPNVNPGPRDAKHAEYSVERTESHYHGFDLYDREKNLQEAVEGGYLCKYCPGYYSFRLRKQEGDYQFVLPGEVNPPSNAREALFIVLNTSTTRLGFAKGTVDEKQLEWLKGQLERNTGKLIFAFGHHPLDGPNFLDDSYKEVIRLFHQHHVIAYFCGHTHAHQIRYHEKEGASQGFWEVITDSILEYPQEGSLVTIYNLGNGVGAMDVQSFGKNITEECKLKSEAELSFKDAEKDHYREIAEQDRNARLTFRHPYFAK
jgi:predicted phosphodiesterase